MTILELLLLEFDDERAGTRRILECVPEASLSWKPHEKSMSLGRLASHVADLPQRCIPIISTDRYVRPADHKPFAAGSTQELIAHFESVSDAARAALAGVQEEALDVRWSLEMNGRVMASLPRGLALRRVFMDHLIHHRGQLSVYLRLLDVPIPGMYGPSADDSARAATR